MAAGVTGVTAAKRHQQLQEEEETMTQYTRDELDQDWEFKIIRSNMGAFRKPDVLQQMLKEESEAGWVLVEKFDDTRVRLKRPRAAHARDQLLAIDPYRSYYGMGAASTVFFILAIVFGSLLITGLIVFAIISAVGNSTP